MMKRLLLIPLLLALSACQKEDSAAPPKVDGVQTLDAAQAEAFWQNPRAFMGKRIAVRGYLMFEDHNRNLFASPLWDKDWNTGRCVSVSAPDVNSKAAKDAAEKNGTEVWLIGKMDQIVPEDELSFDSCRKVGIVAESVR